MVPWLLPQFLNFETSNTVSVPFNSSFIHGWDLLAKWLLLNFWFYTTVSFPWLYLLVNWGGTWDNRRTSMNKEVWFSKNILISPLEISLHETFIEIFLSVLRRMPKSLLDHKEHANRTKDKRIPTPT